jgi:hypothetical protein
MKPKNEYQAAVIEEFDCSEFHEAAELTATQMQLNATYAEIQEVHSALVGVVSVLSRCLKRWRRPIQLDARKEKMK